MAIVRIADLKVVDLKDLLRERNLPTGGSKAELVQRLEEATGCTEIEFIDKQVDEQDDVRAQIDNLRSMLQSVMTLVQQQATANTQSITGTRGVIPPDRSSVSPRNREFERRNVFSVKEISETLPEYDPTKDSVFSIEQFIARVEKAMSVYDWDEKSLMLAVYGKLKGPAKLWVDASSELYVSWSEFAAALRAEFGVVSDEADIHFKMSNSTRKTGESVNEYCFRMSALGKRYHLSDSAIIKYTREGLKHRELQAAIATVRFRTTKEMRDTLEEYFANMASCSSKARPTEFQKRNDYGNKNENKTSEAVAKPAKQERKPIVCYNCSETGHISSACPKPPKRPRCKDCQRVHPRGSPENCGKSNLRNTNSVKKHFTDKKILINDIEMFALIDTGSECSMIRRSKAFGIDIVKRSCNIRISGVCGGTRILTEVMKVKLKIDDVELEVDLFIADDDVFSSDVIIGNDVFADNNVRLIFNDSGQRFEYLNVANTIANDEPREETTSKITEIQHGDIDKNTKDNLISLVEEYRSIFGNELSELGLTDVIKMEIKLDTNTPVVTKPYRLPETKKDSVRKMIDGLLANGIIVKSKSEYASPIVLVKKKNGNDRLCVDYRRLNQHMIKEIFPTPNIEERLQEVMKFKYFTVLDLNSGYYQIPIEEASQKFTAFVTPDGAYEFKRMPFGLKNAPAVFQRLMAIIRDKTNDGDVIHYMDDIVVGSYDMEEMFEKLRRVFSVLRELNLTLNVKKCKFFEQTVEFLGHKIHNGAMSPGAAKTNAILEFPTPSNVREVRQFLGLSGYFRKFVPGYALISEPLRKLLKKDVHFHWNDEQNKAFLALKTSLTTIPVIVGYKTTAEHQIHTDASTIGLAGVLLQREGDDWKPVAFFSRSTTNDETNYHSYELEALAVVESLERFRCYVYGKSVTVITDCNAIKTTMQKKELIPRIARWWLRIQDFDVNIEHRSGQRMQHVDALSRAPYEEPHELDTASMRISKTTISENDLLFSMQLQDEKICEIVEKVKAGDKEMCNEYVIRDGRLFRKQKDKCLWVVPKALRWRVIQGQHDNAGHLGVEKTLQSLQKHFWFPRMRNVVKSHIKSCVECAYNKAQGGKREGEYHYENVNPVPFHTVHMDHLGPFPKSASRNEHLLVIVDAFTKYTILKAVKTTATKHVVSALNEMCVHFGMPTRIITDRGTSFTSNEFERYCKANNVKHILNAVRTPRANGHVERTNRTILGMLLPSTEEDKRWDDQLRRIQWSLNTMKNKTTGRTPQELLFGFEPRDILQNKLVLALQNSETTDVDSLQELRTTTAQRIDAQREAAKQRYDGHHATPKHYKTGDLVLVENEPAAIGTSRKLEPLYKGPFLVTEVLDKDRYVIEDLPGSSRTQRHYRSIYASDKIKPWCTLPEYDDYSSDDEDENHRISQGSIEVD